ncbi:MAG TPA: hypothetical protein VGJ60_22980 [Chloroflexota bacterium]
MLIIAIPVTILCRIVEGQTPLDSVGAVATSSRGLTTLPPILNRLIAYANAIATAGVGFIFAAGDVEGDGDVPLLIGRAGVQRADLELQHPELHEGFSNRPGLGRLGPGLGDRPAEHPGLSQLRPRGRRTCNSIAPRNNSPFQRCSLMSFPHAVWRLALAAGVAAPVILHSPTAAAQTPPPAPDYQRYITFHNDFDFPIYPVIQVPSDLCDGDQVTKVRRILVNGSGHDGLYPQQTLTVLIPNERRDVIVKGVSEVRRCWYASGRIYVFAVDIAEFEAAMLKLDPSNEQGTYYNDPVHPREAVTCFDGKRGAQGAAGDCFTGVANNSFAADVPAQLAEFTLDSDNASASKDPDTGTPMADIDVSNVDDVYLPVAASVENHGATGYMGSAMKLDTFEQRLDAFYASGWPAYSAYLEPNWADNAFSALLPSAMGGSGNKPALHLPAGFNSVQNTLSRGRSSLYNGSDAAPNYLISGVLEMDSQVQPYIDRWMAWVDGDPCANLQAMVWPDNITGAFDKQQFCQAFQATTRTVWNHFLTDETDGFQHHQVDFLKDCGLEDIGDPDRNLINACIIQHIVGYNSGVLGGALPGQVQALLRGVAFEPDGDGRQYQFDPFLTFSAPTHSQFALDPFTRLIHSNADGIGAVAYSFSIDDKYGNFRDASSGFVVDAGGTTALDNKQPYDPYQQYKLNWSYNPVDAATPAVGNWTGASVCGVDVPMNGPGSQRLPLVFQNGSYQACTIKVTDSFGGTLTLDLAPTARNLLDTYTGATVSAFGLPIGDTYSSAPLITSNLSAGDVQTCQRNSSLPDLCASVTLSATWASDALARDVVYMGLDPKAMPRVNVNLPAAPRTPPDANQVTWPPDASIKSQLQSDGMVLVSWPAARVGSGALLQYLLYVKNGANWDPVGGCDASATSCRAALGPAASLYVIAVDNSASPRTQTPQLFGMVASSLSAHRVRQPPVVIH